MNIKSFKVREITSVEDKIIETENTKKSYEECVNKVEHWDYEKEKFEKLEKEFDEYKKKYKYKNRFFNKKLKISH